jgi:hypothetical protein
MDEKFAQQFLERVLWKKGEENPFITDAQTEVYGIKCACQVCRNLICYQHLNINPICGGNFQCPTCKDIYHIPSVFFY